MKVRRHANLCDHAEEQARLFRPQRRHHGADGPIAAEQKSERRSVAEHRIGRQIKGRGDASGVPGRLNTTGRQSLARSMPRCPFSPSGMTMRSPTTGGPANRRLGRSTSAGNTRKRTQRCFRRGRRAFHEYMPLRWTQAEPGRVYRKISYGPARCLHARHAQLSRAQR